MDKYSDLPVQIWTTRISRVNAEKRLIKKEAFFQGINIYYSCLTIIFSILALINKNDKLSLMTVFMTISLFIVILYLNGQKYLEQAREYRKNYTRLQKLEFDLKSIDESDIGAIKEIYSEYCDLLDSSSNHISFDYYEAVHGSSGEYREKRWKNIRAKYYWNVGWRVIIKLCVIILPVILYVICGEI
ncbi:MAG: SLATT domain-containing protein [Lachnospiraceae bacterium]|nr:SLATT domain-containing protein [Lachnospiraceae bacterium]